METTLTAPSATSVFARPYIVRVNTLEIKGGKSRVTTIGEYVDLATNAVYYYATMCHDADQHIKTESIKSLNRKVVEEEPFATRVFDPQNPKAHREFTYELARKIQLNPDKVRRRLNLKRELSSNDKALGL